jgi:1-aminocyclopropane-1-carboxylate deaminase/D-cysteine desulfhydrase-like pyridoxal-dependent ACC family enzyme
VANAVCKILSLGLNFTADDFESFGDYAGESYGVLTPESREAVLMAARTEGLLLDPVYSGKTFGALVDDIRKGTYTKDQTVVFVHTGGTPALFAYADELLGSNP